MFRHDLYGSSANIVVCTNCRSPSISGDGRLIAYEAKYLALDTPQVFVKDLDSGYEQLISRNRFGAGPGNGPSTSPQLSPDGRFVVFASEASDLVPDDTNGFSDIFLRDRLLGMTALLSVNH